MAWRLSDRIGLGLAWALGLLFCAIAAAIVIFMAVQGLRYLTPGLLFTNPVVGVAQNQSGGFLGRDDRHRASWRASGIAVAGPVGTGVAVWLTEYGRPTWLARVVEIDDRDARRRTFHRVGVVRHSWSLRPTPSAS